MAKTLKLLNRPISLWFISIILFAVSLEAILSFPPLLKSSQTIFQYVIITCHALYAVTGLVIILGLWLPFKYTSTIVIIWGFASLGAALGGPLAFSQPNATFPRTAIIMATAVFMLTAGLFLYSRNIFTKKQDASPSNS